MRKLGIIAVLSLMALALAAVPALAAKPTDTGGGNPHFISASGSVDPNTGALLVTFKEAGLGTNQLINYDVTIASASADYQCYNKPGNIPQADNKHVEATNLNLDVGTFSSGQNGQVTQTNLAVPGTPLDEGDFSCPRGQVLFLDGVSYTNVTLVDSTNNRSIPLGSFSDPDIHIRLS
jgi:hypothetical protein